MKLVSVSSRATSVICWKSLSITGSTLIWADIYSIGRVLFCINFFFFFFKVALLTIIRLGLPGDVISLNTAKALWISIAYGAIIVLLRLIRVLLTDFMIGLG